jgi:hypothetical protein
MSAISVRGLPGSGVVNRSELFTKSQTNFPLTPVETPFAGPCAGSISECVELGPDIKAAAYTPVGTDRLGSRPQRMHCDNHDGNCIVHNAIKTLDVDH